MCTKNSSKCSFDKYDKNKLLPDCCKANLKKMFNSTIHLMNKNNIEYFLDFGSLLGCVRDKQIIPYDTDGDISILENSTSKFLQIIPILTENGYDLVPMNKTKTFYKLYFSNINRLHIDIHIRQLNKSGYYITQYSIKNWGIHKNDLLPLKKSTFEGFHVTIPNKYWEYLENGYGKNCIKQQKRKNEYKNKF